MKRLWAPWRLNYVTDDKAVSNECPFCGFESDDSRDQEQHVVYRGEHSYALLNRYPYTNGHVLVLPYQHQAELDDLDSALATDLHESLVLTVRAVKGAYGADGINLGMNMGSAAGAGIAAHLHYHVVPRWSGDTNFMPVISETKVLPEELSSTADKLRRAFGELKG